MSENSSMLRIIFLLRHIRRAVLLYFLIVGTMYVFTIPVGRAPDEIAHLAYINFVARHMQLPNQYVPSLYVYDEGHQPPLYYILGALLVRAVNGGPAYAITYEIQPKLVGTVAYRNGHNTPHLPLVQLVSGKDLVGFTLLRLFSLLTGAGILALIFKISELFFPDSFWQVVPALFAATLPQFLFNCAYINNDVLSNLLTTATLLYSFRILAGSTRRTDFLLMGITMGLSFCDKKTGLFLFPCVFACLCWTGVQNHWGLRSLVARLGGTFGLALLVSIGMLLRNRILYGDWLATRMEHHMLAPLMAQKSICSPYFRHEFPDKLYHSFIGVFGWMDVALPERIYKMYTLLLRIGGVGACLYFARSLRSAGSARDCQQRVIALGATGYLACCTVGIVVFNLTYSQAQGRYLFCVLASIGVLLTLGLKTLYELTAMERVSLPIRSAIGVAGVLILFYTDTVALLTIHNYYR